MAGVNASEQLVSRYFDLHGVEYHWIPRTREPTPDLRVVVEPKPIFVEVKEFDASGKPPTSGYCPVPFVSQKIRNSWRQFEDYSDHPCCLMLYNAGSFKVWLHPELILCAMFGEYYQTLDSLTYSFSGEAAMRPDRNTYISAVAGLLPLIVDENCIDAGRRVFDLTAGFKRELSQDEAWQINRDSMNVPRRVDEVMRVVVVENPFARNPLPDTLFTGPFDERWHRGEEGVVRLKRSGGRVAEMRTLLPEYAQKTMGLW